MFADITAAVAEVAGSQVDTLANLDDQVGLPKVRRDARNVARDLRERNVDFELIGGLDEYPVTGDAVTHRLPAAITTLPSSPVCPMPYLRRPAGYGDILHHKWAPSGQAAARSGPPPCHSRA